MCLAQIIFAQIYFVSAVELYTNRYTFAIKAAFLTFGAVYAAIKVYSYTIISKKTLYMTPSEFMYELLCLPELEASNVWLLEFWTGIVA
jgi:hypothetical protein